MPAPSIFKLPWPRGGFVEDSPRTEQPEGTTTDCLNVRNYDSLERRNRGGKRSGLSKLAADAVNSTNAIQNIRQIVEAVDLVQTAGFGEQFTNPTAALSVFESEKVRYNPAGTRLMRRVPGDTSALELYAVSGSVVSTLGSAHTLDPASVSVIYDYRWGPNGDVLFLFCDMFSGNSQVQAWSYDPSTGFGSMLDSVTVAGTAQVFGDVTPDGAAVVALSTTSPFLEGWPWTGSAFGTKFSAPATNPGAGVNFTTKADYIQFNRDGDVLFLVANGISAGPLQAYRFDSATGFGTKYANATVGTVTEAGFAINPSSTFLLTTGGVAGNDIRVQPFDKTSGFGSATSEDLAPSGTFTKLDPQFSPDGKYFSLTQDSAASSCGVWPFGNVPGTKIDVPSTLGDGAYTAVWNPITSAITFGVGSAGTTNRGLVTYSFNFPATNPSARTSRLVVTSGGSVYRSNTDYDTFTGVSNGSGAFAATSPYVDSAIAFQKLFFCDGKKANYQYLDFSDNTLKDWATDVTAGTLPEGTTDTTLGCRIITNYRGRIVMSGLREDPQNWFMSAKDDPFDWDYSPATTSATQAVAGNNANAGLMGDIITGLFPFRDDLMVMGGANEINIMAGDPADGGAIDNLTRNVGIVGPHAGAFDTVGNFYFFAVNGLYRVSAGLGAQPQLVSQGRLDRVFTDIDVSANDIRLTYDPFWQGVHIFVVPTSQPSTGPIHFFYDERNDAFWRDQYPANVGPTATAYLAADNPEESGLVIGGWDSFIRRFDPDARADDGTAISSFIRFTPLAVGDIFASSRIDDMTVLLDKGSGPTTFKLFAGDTVEDAEDQADADTPRFKRTVLGGRNTPFRPRVSQNAFVVELSHDLTDSTFAYEAAGGRVAVLNRMRGRRV